MRQGDRFKKLALATFGLALGVGAAWVIGRLVAGRMGIRDPWILHENQIAMWRPDPVLGFANRPHFSGYCFGTVRVITDGQGFRGSRPPRPEKTAGLLRIICLGDSVMWGTGVQEGDALPGVLAELLADRGERVEVINAGVVGYATLQEYLRLRELLDQLRPDVVLLNLCVNDLLPTEDPFGNVRTVYRSYLEGLLGPADGRLNEPEREVVRWLAGLMASDERVWESVDWEHQSLAAQRAMVKALMEIPLAEMGRACREKGARLICLLIPTRDGAAGFEMLLASVRALLERERIEVLDLSAELVQPAGHRLAANKQRGGVWGALRRALRSSPLRDLDSIMTVRGIEYAHEHFNFIDHWHPSRRGNRIIAERVAADLAATGPPAASP